MVKLDELDKAVGNIVTEFRKSFAPDAEIIYTEQLKTIAKQLSIRRLSELGVNIESDDQLPSIILFSPEKHRLMLVDASVSHGVVDACRRSELAKLFSQSDLHLIMITAFPNREIMAEVVEDIAWETEAWVADAPTHMIHFGGDQR